MAAHCTDPDALSRTLECVDAYLVLYCGGDGSQEDLRIRSARLQHAMAAGFAQELRERTLAEQEAISVAALQAQGVVAQALHATEARFRAVFEGAAIGIGMADLEGNILQVNGALLRHVRDLRPDHGRTQRPRVDPPGRRAPRPDPLRRTRPRRARALPRREGVLPA
ncbi:PAS domain S-box protein [Streptomyces sp. L7]